MQISNQESQLASQKHRVDVHGLSIALLIDCTSALPPHGFQFLLAQQVTKEMDSEKLLILVTELNRALDEEFGASDQQRSPVEKPYNGKDTK
jgi:hypothetical protein